MTDNAGHRFGEARALIMEAIEKINDAARLHKEDLRKIDGGNPDTLHNICHMVAAAARDLNKLADVLGLTGLNIRKDLLDKDDLIEKERIQDEMANVLKNALGGLGHLLMGESSPEKQSIPDWDALHDELVEESKGQSNGKEECKHPEKDKKSAPAADVLKALKITPPKRAE